MEYQLLTKLYYKDRELYHKECELRRSSLSSVHLPIMIHSHPAFYVNCPQLTQFVTDIFQNLLHLKKQIEILPPIAYKSYARNCLVDEILLTNDIEGVYSTKKEITDILESKDNGSEKETRLRGLVKKYAMLYSDGSLDVRLSNSADIRTLYDEIVLSEIKPSDHPDGKVFRKDSVSVVTVTDKEKHRGVPPPESNIINTMDAALGLLNSKDVPKIIAICLLHYFFGYIHPFYDGNGRLSRFISSYLIRETLDPLLSLRLSYSVKNNKKAYYDAFDIVNDERNHGDATPFILMFLNVILESEKSLISKLEIGIEQLDFFYKQLQIIEPVSNLDNVHFDILFALIQNELFGNQNFEVNSLCSALNISPATLRRRLSEISESPLSSLVTTYRDKRKHRYSINLDILDEFCNICTQ